ncbi:outer membrane chaperone Skp [Cellulophaga geojensis KL-A]|uniref:Outer membrane chaperone Skp n=1 Tax=Cellulophaga geojensis KL-A TaxID=1328323 RepID=A0ABN0RTC1_9FLAO|nr:OmpH family outer membrane protein [Cellulophaga geojensis]EWH15185.1 outer membrane chaperone Skp [Cellulophaga geojensis KL-A]
MKTKVLLILTTLLLSTSIFAQRGVRVAYVDMEYILENVEEYREATEQLASKVEKWKLEIEGEKKQIYDMRQTLLAEKVLLTNELIEEREEEISLLEKEMLQYQQDRFGPQGDLVMQKLRLVQPIQDQVFSEVQKIGKNKNYDFIFDKSADVVMLYAEKRNDISELVLRAISRTRKISAPKKSARSRFEDEEEEKPITEALRIRQEQAKEADAARAKSAEEKRAEQLKLREERKKAYEARRKKLLEEKAAKQKKTKEEKDDN